MVQPIVLPRALRTHAHTQTQQPPPFPPLRTHQHKVHAIEPPLCVPKSVTADEGEAPQLWERAHEVDDIVHHVVFRLTHLTDLVGRGRQLRDKG